ncbi:hypothetical protein K3G63_17080 [Hymenobacter sp. HSC-4F20]|uniref:hypothetical protein n=1 Tax=Hymenobacter sp. HSC-4F20 TaxID=2864135 RepID=UPI001C737186|nr:hypothetical protein [Hymenobacter sp. HSC-4F20]MBX0292165.1 hypothetical protein [Hymenobacter sp. HSC-4F20]
MPGTLTPLCSLVATHDSATQAATPTPYRRNGSSWAGVPTVLGQRPEQLRTAAMKLVYDQPTPRGIRRTEESTIVLGAATIAQQFPSLPLPSPATWQYMRVRQPAYAS